MTGGAPPCEGLLSVMDQLSRKQDFMIYKQRIGNVIKSDLSNFFF